MGEGWKALERLAAAALGGQRHIRWNRFERAADIDLPAEGPAIVVECKYRKRLPKLLADGLAQAAGYAPGKAPVLVIKERGQAGALVVLRLADFSKLLHPKEDRHG